MNYRKIGTKRFKLLPLYQKPLFASSKIAKLCFRFCSRNEVQKNQFCWLIYKSVWPNATMCATRVVDPKNPYFCPTLSVDPYTKESSMRESPPSLHMSTIGTWYYTNVVLYCMEFRANQPTPTTPPPSRGWVLVLQLRAINLQQLLPSVGVECVRINL